MSCSNSWYLYWICQDICTRARKFHSWQCYSLSIGCFRIKLIPVLHINTYKTSWSTHTHVLYFIQQNVLNNFIFTLNNSSLASSKTFWFLRKALLIELSCKSIPWYWIRSNNEHIICSNKQAEFKILKTNSKNTIMK